MRFEDTFNQIVTTLCALRVLQHVISMCLSIPAIRPAAIVAGFIVVDVKVVICIVSLAALFIAVALAVRVLSALTFTIVRSARLAQVRVPALYPDLFRQPDTSIADVVATFFALIERPLFVTQIALVVCFRFGLVRLGAVALPAVVR